MARLRTKKYLLFTGAMALVMIGAVFEGLRVLDERMTVRYQAVGKVVDAQLQPLQDVEVLLLLAVPDQRGGQLDRLFAHHAEMNGHGGARGVIRKAVGPTVGLSGEDGGFVVRAVGRSGAAQAIRIGFQSQTRPPFEVAWLVLRKPGYQDLVRTISILGWKRISGEWGREAESLPVSILSKTPSP